MIFMLCKTINGLAAFRPTKHAQSKVRMLHLNSFCMETATGNVLPDYIELLAERLINNVFGVERVSNRIHLVKLILSRRFFTFISVYASQWVFLEPENDCFFDQFKSLVNKITALET